MKGTKIESKELKRKFDRQFNILLALLGLEIYGFGLLLLLEIFTK